MTYGGAKALGLDNERSFAAAQDDRPKVALW